ncbi:MAG TPA: hypothetical protein VIB48_10020 [Acidimicrobiia bacterium]
MRHARADDLAGCTGLLGELRALDGVRERTAGSFYRRGAGFLHFHVDGDRLFADVKVDGDWQRVPASSARERRELVRFAARVIREAGS